MLSKTQAPSPQADAMKHGVISMGQWRKAATGLQQFQRVATAVPVRVSTVDPEVDPTTGRTFFRTAKETTANLSRGGAYVRTWEPLAAGRRVILTLDFSERQDGSQELQLVGKVAWTRRELTPGAGSRLEQPGYGVEFIEGSRFQLDALSAHLTRLESKPLGTVSPFGDSPVPKP